MPLTSGLGSSYSPTDQQKKTQLPGTPIQQALQILSLHLPRILGAGAPAPRELLAAGGQFRPAPNVTGLVQQPAPAPGPSGGGGGGGRAPSQPQGRAAIPGFNFGQQPGTIPSGPISITPRPGYGNTGVVPPAPAPGPTGPTPEEMAAYQLRMQQWQASQGYRGGAGSTVGGGLPQGRTATPGFTFGQQPGTIPPRPY